MDNASGATIEAVGGTLTIKNGNAVVNAGTLEAATGAFLQINDGSIDNTGTFNGTTGGVVVFGTLVAGQPAANGGTLQLTGGGTVTLAGGAISSTGANGGDALVNMDNTISGYGTIGISAPNVLNLTNKVGGSIEALALGTKTLAIITASVINNAGTLEAATGATLQIGPNQINNSGNIQVDGVLSVSDFGNPGSTFVLHDGRRQEH